MAMKTNPLVERRTASVDSDEPLMQVSLRNIALATIAIGGAMAVLHWAQAVFIPIVLSLLISFALDPIVRALTRVWVPRVLASAVVVLALVGALGYTGYALSDDATAIVADLPEAATKLRQSMRRPSNEDSTMEQVERAAQELQRTADEASARNPAPRGVQRVQIEEPAIDVREYLSWGSASAAAFFAQAVLIMFFVFFLLASGDLFKRKLVRIAGPTLERRKITVQLLDEIATQIERFLLVHLVASIVVGLATWIAFRWVGLEQAGVWAVAAGVFNNIPYFGPVIVSGGAAVVGFLQFGTISMGLYVAAIAMAITTFEGFLLTPLMTKRTARVNEVAIFVALIFWSFVWGIWGTLLAVPMLVSVKAFCDRVEQLKPIGELLGE
jgi:predicted PurR-regulated permease PerM